MGLAHYMYNAFQCVPSVFEVSTKSFNVISNITKITKENNSKPKKGIVIGIAH